MFKPTPGNIEQLVKQKTPLVREYLIEQGHNLQTRIPDMNCSCIIDTETTGLEPGKDQILDICIMPINADCTINENHSALRLYIKPTVEMSPDVPPFMRRNYETAKQYGVDAEDAKAAVISWLKRNNIDKISPVGHNYIGFDRGFIYAWLGKEIYQAWFDYHIEDTMSMAHLINRKAILTHGRPVFDSVKLERLAAYFGIPPRPELDHTAFGDCMTTLEVYRRMLGILSVSMVALSK